MRIFDQDDLAYPEKIILLEAHSNYTIVYYENGGVKVVAYSLHLVGEYLSDSIAFIRPNRRYMVNLSHVKNYDGNSVFVHNLRINVSRRRKESLEHILTREEALFS